MLLKPKLFHTQLSFFKTHSTQLSLTQLTVSVLGKGHTADLILKTITPIAQRYDIAVKHYEEYPPVMLERDDGWFLPFSDGSSAESHFCILVTEDETQQSITESTVPLIQYLLAQGIMLPNTSRKGIQLRENQTIQSPHRLSHTLFVVGSLSHPTPSSVDQQIDQLQVTLFGSIKETS